MEKESSDSPVCLLFKPKNGRRRPGRKKVLLEKGELLQELEQPYLPDQFSAEEHNYHVYNDTTVTLNCGATDVLPLAGVEHQYLLAVSTKDRIKEFNNEKKREYVMGLIYGDRVCFKIDDDSSPGRGRIRYLGFVKHKEGVHLGVEIDEVREIIRTANFLCHTYHMLGCNCAVTSNSTDPCGMLKFSLMCCITPTHFLWSHCYEVISQKQLQQTIVVRGL